MLSFREAFSMKLRPLHYHFNSFNRFSWFLVALNYFWVFLIKITQYWVWMTAPLPTSETLLTAGYLNEIMRQENQRVGHAEVEIQTIEKTNSTILPEYQGVLVLENETHEYVTSKNLKTSNKYRVVFERTENLLGEPVIEIHDIINEQSKN